MNHQYTLVPLNMDRIPLTNQDPNRHMVAGAPPFRKPPAGPTPGAAPRAPSAEPAQTNHRNRYRTVSALLLQFPHKKDVLS